jgi:hypothetical protein
MHKNIVISLCDYSGVWSEPYRNAGYEVYQIDLKLGGDAILFPSAMSSAARLPRQFADIGEFIGKVYAVLAAPVCTVFSGSGAKHPRSDDDIRAGLSLVDACYRIATVTECDVFALEQPVGKTRKWIGEPIYRFHPYQFAGLADNPSEEAYTKRTCLFGWFNTQLAESPVDPVDGSKLWRQYGGKSERTKEMRSITPQGFARAFYNANNNYVKPR